MERGYFLSNIVKEMKTLHDDEMGFNMMNKCTKVCFISFKEEKLLPSEESCLKKCYQKSIDFNKFFEDEMKYTLRSINYQSE